MMDIKEFKIQTALGLLSFSHDEKIKMAEGLDTHVDILCMLSKDADPEVRMGAARNPNTPVGILIKLSTDNDWGVQYYIIDNPNTPVDVLEGLSKDDDWFVAERAVQRLKKS